MNDRLYFLRNSSRKILFLLISILLFGCGSNNPNNEDEVLKVINLLENKVK